MSLAKLGSGDGYTYYLRSIATHDVNDRGPQDLSTYYSERGESPGRWLGSGLPNVGIAAGEVVTEEQMRALFGHGMHPNAEAMIAAEVEALAAEGISRRTARAHAVRLVRLGVLFTTHAVAEYSYRYERARAYAAYNAEHGRVDYAPIPAEQRSRIATEVSQRMFAEEYGRPPRDDRELSGWVARASRASSKRVAGFDLTFSPVKSVSTLWALAPREVSEKIEAAVDAALRDVLAYLEEHAVFTRVGRHSRRQVDVVGGLIATAFQHRDSRAGDPNLHVHVVVSNAVKRHDGQWGALDGRMIYQHNVAASELFNTRLEHYLEQSVGVQFAERHSSSRRRRGKRPVREIVGVEERLAEEWSKRSAAVDAELTTRTTRFQAERGREPTPGELHDLAQEATLKTRGHKVAARSRAEQRADWRRDGVQLLGGESAVDAMVATALGQPIPQREVADAAWVAATAARVVEVVSDSRATWQFRHIRAEATRQLRGSINPADWHTLITQVTDTALSEPRSIPRGTPEAEDIAPTVEALTRRDGTSVFTTSGSQLYTSPQNLAAEERLIAASLLEGGRTIAAAAVDAAIIEHAANNNGQVLNDGQVQLLREFATSGRRFHVAVAPAGTGKTTAMAALVRAWTAEGGTVLGLAPEGPAAGVLGSEIGADSKTVDMLVTVINDIRSGERALDDAPDWLRAIGPRTLVVLDEAAKTPTLKLDSAVSWLIERGASVRAVGDDRQLSSVQAGGVIRDIVHHAGAATLTRVVRFDNPSERAASLALRHGDTAAIAFYTDHGRVHVGTLGAVVHAAYRAWRLDYAQGRDVALLAPTNELVRQLNALARDERLRREGLHGPETLLSDGLSSSVGDIITTRENNYRLRISHTDHVRNGYRWKVRAVHADGRITATHIGSGRNVTLPTDYVRECVELGYARTINSAQGLTTDTCHGVLTGSEDCFQLYVLASRARAGGHLYLATAGDGAEGPAQAWNALHPPTAIDMLTQILGRDGSQVSATTQARYAADPQRQLAGVVDASLEALVAAADTRLGAEHHTTISAAAERLMPGLTDEAAWPVLRQHLAMLTLAGHDPITTLTDAVTARELDTTDDKAAVLVWRIGQHAIGSGPLGWIPVIPAILRDDTDYGEHLRVRAVQIKDLAAQIGATAHAWTPATAPVWARQLVEHDPNLIASLAIWRAAHAVPDHDCRPTGPVQYPVDERRIQLQLDAAVRSRLGDLDSNTRRWTPLGREVDERITTDPYWPQLAEGLSHAAATGLDVATAVRTAAAQRPLPDEQPAAALRWRLVEMLDDAQRRRADQLARAVSELRVDQWRRMSDRELEDEIQSARRDFDLDPILDMGLIIERSQRSERGSDADAVRRAHAELDQQAAAIYTARTAQAAVVTAEHALTLAQRQQATAQNNPPKIPWWRPDAARAEHASHLERLRQALNDAQQNLLAAREIARRNQAAVQLAQDDWNSTLHRADNHAARAAELTAAGHSDNAFARKLAQAEQRWLCEERQLDDAFTEQQRRTQLTPPQRDLEDRARRHLDRDAHDGLAFAQPTALTETGASREEPVDTPEIGTDYEYSHYDYGL
ncbi:MobF family relaxase [Nocardia beijingensis]|uniref:MobF family relaxase n=1 Tax=Nocardia beijingensis TaxID=95162 RepID=UPI001E49D5D0|nr:MobF family relaxase [Nocardia beijingensis]